MHNQPATPDFDVWPVTHRITAARAAGDAIHVNWCDGKSAAYHKFMLRENSTDPISLNPLSRESNITPLDIPDDLTAQDIRVLDDSTLQITWSDGHTVSHYHPGWLRAHGWFDGVQQPDTIVRWTGEEYPTPPTFNGPAALEDPGLFLGWLQALRDFGIARLEGLPQKDGLLLEIVESIGTVRASNFGKTYTLDIKDVPDSNAFTSIPLPPHIDLPTRETPPGLQFLYCRENSTTGGEGIYADAYRVAEDMRREEPDHFQALTDIDWRYNNRSADSDYQATGPIIALDKAGNISGVRYNTWLRAPMTAPLDTQTRAYNAVRAYARRTMQPEYQMTAIYRPGDLLAFDNRRALHGRKAYDAKGGRRFIEGVYSDRDDLYSAIRIRERQQRAEQQK